MSRSYGSNAAIGELKTATDAGAAPGLATSPYKDIGDWFEDDVYYDGDLNATQGGGESTINKALILDQWTKSYRCSNLLYRTRFRQKIFKRWCK